MNNRLIILAGGASSRMKLSKVGEGLSNAAKHQANTRHKGLIAVGGSGKPLIYFLIKNAKDAGYKCVYLLIRENTEHAWEELVNDPVLDGIQLNLALQYVPDNRKKPLGTADAVLQTMKQYPELKKLKFTVCNGDNLYSVKALSLLSESSHDQATIAYDSEGLQFPLERISKFAVMNFDQNYNLLDIVEKPSDAMINSFRDSSGKLRISMNIFAFDGKIIFKYLSDCPIHPERDEKELPTAIRNMLNDYPESMKGIVSCEHVPDLTSKTDIKIMQDYIQNNYNDR